MKKILVTGANGYIGCHTVRALLDLGAQVVAVDLRHDRVDPRAVCLDYDIFHSDEKTFEALGCPDVCLHLAWMDGFVHNAPSHLASLGAHYAFIQNMAQSGCKQIAVMGSMHEVGYTVGAVTEDTPANPMSLYGIAKNALRQAVLLLAGSHRDVTFQWLRGYYIVGDDAHGNSIFAKLIAKAQSGEKTFPFTSGKNEYDFISLGELALEIALSVLQDEVTGIINCASGHPVSLKDRVCRFISDKKLDITLEYGAFPDRAYDSPCIYGDSTKIKQIVENACGKYGAENEESIRALRDMLA